MLARRLRADGRRQPGPARLDDGRARPQPRQRPAREPRDQRPVGARRPARPAADHARRPRLPARGRGGRGRARRPRRRDPRRAPVRRLGRLLAVGPRGAARALGRRLRADGHRQPRGVPRRRARPDAADRRPRRRASQQGPCRRTVAHLTRAGRRARRRVGRLHGHRSLRDRPELHRRRPVGRGARAVRRAARQGRRRAARRRRARQAGARASGRRASRPTGRPPSAHRRGSRGRRRSRAAPRAGPRAASAPSPSVDSRRREAPICRSAAFGATPTACC